MARLSSKEIIQLQKTGLTDAEIGNHVGITRQAVHQLRKKYGISADQKRNDKRDKSIVSAYKKKGQLKVTEIAHLHDLSPSQAYRIIAKYTK
jgi:DNA-directed RNA polymerase specialized sigma subunit